MKAGLPQKEPVILAAGWKATSTSSPAAPAKAREVHPSHGPPYQWRHAHRPCAEPILKDMVVPPQTLLGKTRPTCRLGSTAFRSSGRSRSSIRKKKLNKDEVPVKEFRAECRAMPSIGSTRSASS